ncbi:MAG: hypothetical protein HC861_06135 [Rhodospirillaceae bacterium]|nr:hypothetical protein [Rhodospirillaceae bacterium]
MRKKIAFRIRGLENRPKIRQTDEVSPEQGKIRRRTNSFSRFIHRFRGQVSSCTAPDKIAADRESALGERPMNDARPVPTGHEVIQSYLKVLTAQPGVYRMLDAEARVALLGRDRLHLFPIHAALPDATLPVSASGA